MLLLGLAALHRDSLEMLERACDSAVQPPYLGLYTSALACSCTSLKGCAVNELQDPAGCVLSNSGN